MIWEEEMLRSGMMKAVAGDDDVQRIIGRKRGKKGRAMMRCLLFPPLIRGPVSPVVIYEST